MSEFRTHLTCANGGDVDLLDPRPEDIDFAVIAEHLAKEARYNGATPGLVYSVAQHSVLCAQAALAAGFDAAIAAYCLLHDAHEAYLKDDTTPKKRALAALAQQNFGVLASHIEQTFALLTESFDRAIHDAAGLAYPLSDEAAAIVHRFDRALLLTEWRDLMRAPFPESILPAGTPLPNPPPHPKSGAPDFGNQSMPKSETSDLGWGRECIATEHRVEMLPDPIAPWGWEEAREEFLRAAQRLLPCFAPSASHNAFPDART